MAGGADEVARQALAHADALYNFARWLARDAVEAEDLVQEAYARALAGAGQFQPGSNLKAWLFRILRNVFIDRRRRAQREAEYAEHVEADVESQEPAAGELKLAQIRALVAEDVTAAVQALPEPHRTVILLDVEGLTESEVAGVLGCAPGTVKSRLSRARAVLRDRLAAYRP